MHTVDAISATIVWNYCRNYSKCWCISERHKYTTAKIPYPARLYTRLSDFCVFRCSSDRACGECARARRLQISRLRPIGIQPLTQMRCWLTLRLKILMLIEFPVELQHPPAYTPTALPYPAPAYTQTRVKPYATRLYPNPLIHQHLLYRTNDNCRGVLFFTFKMDWAERNFRLQSEDTKFPVSYEKQDVCLHYAKN